MDNQTIVAENVTEEQCDFSMETRKGFVSIVSCLSVVGCISNGLLLYVFLCKTGRLYPFQTLLAILDFMLCVLYIECFGFQLLSIELQYEALYNFVMDNNLVSISMSRIVQLLIPYTLIANSADKLAMIYGKDVESKKAFYIRLLVIALLITVGVISRTNTFYMFKIVTDEQCPKFQDKWMGMDESRDESTIAYLRMYERGLTFFHTFVSFVILFGLNSFIVWKLRNEHRRTRRQSTSPAQLFSTSVTRLQVAQTVREQQNKLRCAVKTTVVIITAYLFCNSLNFACYVWESFGTTFESDGTFSPIYLVLSDIATALFVASSSVRIFIYYKYNGDMRRSIKQIAFVKYLIPATRKTKHDVLLKADL